jgi:hypothetical protein
MRTFLFSLSLVALAAAACGGTPDSAPSSGGGEGTFGPKPGAPRRFAVDAIQYPDKPSDFAVDLNGDGVRDNQLATILGVFAANQTDPARSVGRLLDSGELAPVIDLTSDDQSMHLRWQDGSLETTVDGKLTKNTFASESAYKRTQPLSGFVRLPIFADSEPVKLPLVGVVLQLRLEDDGTVSGSLHGAVRIADLEALVMPEIFRAFDQMVTRFPDNHKSIVGLLDRDGDEHVSYEEFKTSPIVKPFLRADVQLFDAAGRWAPNPKNTAPDSLSLGFGFHASPVGKKTVAK